VDNSPREHASGAEIGAERAENRVSGERSGERECQNTAEHGEMKRELATLDEATWAD